MNLPYNNILAASLLMCPAFVFSASGQNVTAVSFANMQAKVDEREPAMAMASEDFITTSANSTAVNIADCTMALRRCNANPVKTFSVELMKEQQGLMKKIKALAFKNDIIIPFDSFVKRNNTLAQLSDDSNFDATFLQKTITTLEANILTFRSAIECDDRWVRLFVADSLPLLEDQLARARSLYDGLN